MDRAAVVIVGGGIVGASVAYHLALLGVDDILLVEKGSFPENPGSTSHAPGGVVSMSHDRLLARLSFYSTDLYRSLERYDQGRNTYNPVGSVEVAVSTDRMADLVREHGEALAYGAATSLLDATEVAAKVPYLDPGAMVGGLFIRDSAIVSGSGISGALVRDGRATGRVRVRDHTLVADVETFGGRVVAVVTGDGERIETDRVVLCTNIWALPVARRHEIPLPMMAFEHQYIETTPLDLGMDPDDPDQEVVYPTVREMDSAMYYRHHWNRIGIGSYAHVPVALAPCDVGETAARPFTPELFGEPWQVARRLIPALADVKDFSRTLNGMFAFTADGMPIIGESGVAGLWLSIAAWITHAAGVGKATAELMVSGEGEWDLRQASIDRFLPYATTKGYVTAVTSKNYREIYDVHHPREPTSNPRNVRLSPFGPRLEAMDPHNVPFAGIELASWYGSNAHLVQRLGQVPIRSEWASLHWSPNAAAEHHACREKGALFDLTGLSILEVSGRSAAPFVDRLCSNRTDVAPGRVVYTTWLTPSGGIKRDLAVARLAESRFWMFVGEGTRPQDLAWANSVRGNDADVVITDISDAYTALGLWGPDVQAILEAASSDDVSTQALGYFRGRWIDVGVARIYAMRISYVGEAGWELHIPVDQALGVFDRIWEAGADRGLVMAGSTAMDSLRIEKGYRLWGADIHTEYDPYEAGLQWTVRLDKEDFVGAEACRKKAELDPARRLSCLKLASGDPLGNEAVLHGDRAVGYVTSAAHGHSVGAAVAYSYLPAELAAKGTEVAVLIGGERHSAVVSQEPLWDPQGNRMRRPG